MSCCWSAAMTSCRRRRSSTRAFSPTTLNRSEEHTSELQSHRDLHSFPTRRSSDLVEIGMITDVVLLERGDDVVPPAALQHARLFAHYFEQIGRASCRERV